jgi:transcriptional regulator with XRE-family HTH domain
MEEFLNAVLDAMQKQRLSTERLATLSGIHRSHLYKILGGTVVPSYDRAEAIAAALGLKISITELTRSLK